MNPDRRRGPYVRGNAARRDIVAAIKRHAGITRSEIVRATGLSWGSVTHHIKQLSERGEIQAARLGRRTIYHTGRREATSLAVVRLLRTEPNSVMVLRVLNRGSPLTIEWMATKLGVGRKTVRRHLALMLDAGLVGLSATRRVRYELRWVPLEFRDFLVDSSEGQEL